MEGDRFPAAILGSVGGVKEVKVNEEGGEDSSKEEASNSAQQSTTSTAPSDPISSPSIATYTPPPHPSLRILRPHQTLPLPGPPYPTAAYLPTTIIPHGNLMHLHLLVNSIPPCAPGSAVLLTTSSQGGPTPETGKLPRTREILARLLAESYELVGSHVDYDGRIVGDAAGVGINGLDIIGGVIGGKGMGRWNTEAPAWGNYGDRWGNDAQGGASEEMYGVTRIIMASGLRDDPFSAFAVAAGKSGGWGHVGNPSTTGAGAGDGGKRGKREHWSQKEEKRRKVAEKRGIEGAEGRWIVRLASRAEAGRLVRSWHMREFWTGIGGPMASKVVMRAEIF
ncbi:hypothetical protein BDZ91DRAFT_708596 [Kalaharituber pfeilii]|nr:hypothetical protein BDZ91DRAFT_708596 [Kalaharituber pfeilii]